MLDQTLLSNNSNNSPHGDFSALVHSPLLSSQQGNFGERQSFTPSNGLADTVIHGTTVIAVKYKDGVINVGDRRATGGFAIMYSEAEKILPIDDYTLLAISGSFSRAIEFVKYLRYSFKYYERSQLQPMSLDGKLNEVGRLISGNMAAAMDGVGLVIPIFSTFDKVKNEGRIFFYDGGGARFETADYGAAGSGSTQIRGAFEYITRTKGSFRHMDRDTALQEALHLLEIAADLDAATGGAGKILPIARTITKDGVAEVESVILQQMVDGILKR
jgi:proteasome beta subunit